MFSVFNAIRDTYEASRKSQDIAWNTYVARPLAAVLVLILKKSPITPNQTTFLGVGVFIIAAAIMVGWSGPVGFLVAALVIQLAYLFDCVDGQLARIKDMTSEIGAYLDFLMDEIKALLLVAAASIRLWFVDGDVLWLFVGIGSVLVVAAATSLTNFVRRPEYAGEQIDPGQSAKRQSMPDSPVGKVVWLVKAVARYFVHYPSWILWAAIIGFFAPVDTALLFLVPFLGVYLMYLGQTALGVIWRLGRPGFYDEH